MCQSYLCRHVAIRSRGARVPACAEIALVGHGDGLEELEGGGAGGERRGGEGKGGGRYGCGGGGGDRGRGLLTPL